MLTLTGAEQPLLFAGPANPTLARDVAAELDITCSPCEFTRYPDGEVSVELGVSVAGREVLLLQPTSPPVNDHLMEVLVFADACRRASAASVSLVAPYFGYARSDRRLGHRVPVTASMVASLMEAVGLRHVVTLNVHSQQIEGFFRIPLDDMSAVCVLADALAPHLSERSVVVAPDLGAVRLATEYGQRLTLPVAVVHKLRRSATEVTSTGITGDVRGRSCIIVDDMITTGGTIEGAVTAVRAAGANGHLIVSATHGVLTESAWQRLARSGVQRLFVTDSVHLHAAEAPVTQIVSVAPLIAQAIGRLPAAASIREAQLFGSG